MLSCFKSSDLKLMIYLDYLLLVSNNKQLGIAGKDSEWEKIQWERKKIPEWLMQRWANSPDLTRQLSKVKQLLLFCGSLAIKEKGGTQHFTRQNQRMTAFFFFCQTAAFMFPNTFLWWTSKYLPSIYEQMTVPLLKGQCRSNT